jgi:2-keto-4-pentenoate hydratase
MGSIRALIFVVFPFAAAIEHGRLEDASRPARRAALRRRAHHWRADPIVTVLRVRRIDPRAVSALERQLGSWRAALRDGAARVGWKLGLGDAERIGDEIAVGHLTSASLLTSGATFKVGESTTLSADAEIAMQLAFDLPADADRATVCAAIGAYAGALELVDLRNADAAPAEVIATNIFHRAVAFGQWHPQLPTDAPEVRLLINGQLRAVAPMPSHNEVAERVRAAARLLGAVNEQLRTGDRIITGSVIQVSFTSGDDVRASFGAFSDVHLTTEP